MITIISGGAQSGKSTISQGIADSLERCHGHRVFIFHNGATASEARAKDDIFDDVMVCITPDQKQSAAAPGIMVRRLSPSDPALEVIL